MRINRFIATASSLSRRKADLAIQQGLVLINDRSATFSDTVGPLDKVTLNGQPLVASESLQTILFNKPIGYVVSRKGQGSKTVYDLLPKVLGHLKPIGRLDKDSSGLLLLTNDGELAQKLSHPRYQKTKIYEVELDKDLQSNHVQMISNIGINLDDGPSQLTLSRILAGNNKSWKVTMQEGRNRQIRRTFAALGYKVVKLHRTNFGQYLLPNNLNPGEYLLLANTD